MNSKLKKLRALLKSVIKEKNRIEVRLAEINVVLGTNSVVASVSTGVRRTFSAATKAKMAASQKARWAKRKAAEGQESHGIKPTKQRKMSAAGRARIAAAAKARWAKAKAAGKKTLGR